MSDSADAGPSPESRRPGGLSYPFEAFLADLDALGGTNHLHDTPSHGLLQSALAHFRAKYVQQRVRIHRLIRFLLAVTYLDQHFHQFDTGEFAVFGSPRGKTQLAEGRSAIVRCAAP